MSKSDPNNASRINLLDTPDEIVKKIKRAKSDSYTGIEYKNDNRPESRNLLMIYSILSNRDITELENEFADMGWGIFKKLLTEQIIESLKPIQERYKILIDDQHELNKILIDGKERAEKIANKSLQRVKTNLGFY